MTDTIHVIAAVDWHELRVIADKIVGEKKFHSHEVGEGEDGLCWGIIYTGKLPEQADIMEILVAAGYKPEY